MFIPAISMAPGDGLAAGEAEDVGMFIPGIFIAGVGDGDAGGVGEGTEVGMFMPGMFIPGVGDGDARGVGEGIGIECGCCCANAEAALARAKHVNEPIHEVTRTKQRPC